MRVLFALPGLHKYDRGAEIAFVAIAKELSQLGAKVTLIGSGKAPPDVPYSFLHAGSLARSHFAAFPSLPVLRHEYAYEELTFVPGLLCQYRPSDYDITVSCSYPFTNWVLRRPALRGRPPHVFVTQNGDWPAYADNSEYRFFGCEGLVCTNPDFYQRNRKRWRCALIPNGVDCDRFKPGEAQRETFGLPPDRLIVLMVSALIPSKRVELGIDAVSRVPNAHLVVAGDGPLREPLEALAARRLAGRFTRLSLPAQQMPSLYRSANVFLHLSQEESFGNVFLEAMASGLPIVAHDSARIRWIVGDDQALIDTNDPNATACGITAAAKQGLATVKNSIARSKTFSWGRVGKMYYEFFCEVAGPVQISSK